MKIELKDVRFEEVEEHEHTNVMFKNLEMLSIRHLKDRYIIRASNIPRMFSNDMEEVIFIKSGDYNSIESAKDECIDVMNRYIDFFNMN